MSKYKVKCYVSLGVVGGEKEEIVDLIEDYYFMENEAEKIWNDEKLLEKFYDEWLWERLDTGFCKVKEEETE